MNSSLSLQALRYGHRQPLFAPLTLACGPVRSGRYWEPMAGEKVPCWIP